MNADKLIASIKAQAETHCFDPLARAQYQVELLQGALRRAVPAVEMLDVLLSRDVAIYAHEITIPLHSHADAMRMLAEARALAKHAKEGT